MISIRPRSILQLTVAGFVSVTGLLFIALLITARQLDGLSERNLTLMSESTAALNLGRTLTELSIALERNARQYRILENSDILALYQERQVAFHSAAQNLLDLQIEQGLQSLLNDIRQLEAQAYQRLTAANQTEIEPLYGEILLVSNRIADAINAWSANQVQDIAGETEDTQQLLTLQAVLLVVVALALAALFTALITRPLLQVKKAIGQLGSGEYRQSISVTGPSDLVSLGERLDWLRERLSMLEQQRSSFLRHVSHELKTPLAAVRESASLLEDEVVGELNEKQKNVLAIQISNAQRLQTLIDELLRHHLQSFSVLNTAPGPVRLDRLLEEVLHTHQVPVRTAGLSINKRLARVTVSGNREQLRVVLDNLLSNAIKFSPRGGEIGVHVDSIDGEAVVEIQDAGPGVASKDTELIFDAFYQGEQPASDVYHGSGLGLAIAREYVDTHGGSLELLPSNTGARFEIRLPLQGRGNDTVN